VEYILKQFPVTGDEFAVLEEKYGQLCEYAAWQLFKKNSKSNHTDDQTDISQELRISLLTAGSYFKRQMYIECSLVACQKYATDPFMVRLVNSLCDLWLKKTHHGANRQKFGPHQERMLDLLVRKLVPRFERPKKDAELAFNRKTPITSGFFGTYCKAITWNRTHTLGKAYTREKPIRDQMVSLSEFDYLQPAR
jgi:hypothetical protein